ncbi:MAG: hypothetical protein KatS3mg114_1428 [Planctomycetaceae bacterium]|nr:MAG: hypothetical protein KatS3mg114_1428 [Planctomycetaceae bacterium]
MTTKATKRVAIADDEPDMRDFLSRLLPRLGFTVVVTAANGEELLQGCRQALPDLIITDLKMPQCDGLSAVQELWQQRPIPVIFITAYPQELTAWNATDATLKLLIKPIRRSDLEQALAEIGFPPS